MKITNADTFRTNVKKKLNKIIRRKKLSLNLEKGISFFNKTSIKVLMLSLFPETTHESSVFIAAMDKSLYKNCEITYLQQFFLKFFFQILSDMIS